MTYKCPVCGMEADEPGECEMCHVPLEPVCEKCGEAESNCSCEEEERE